MITKVLCGRKGSTDVKQRLIPVGVNSTEKVGVQGHLVEGRDNLDVVGEGVILEGVVVTGLVLCLRHNYFLITWLALV